MNGEFIPAIVFDSSQWTVENFNYYDRNGFMPALIQILHRMTAYVLIAMILWFFFKMLKTPISNVLKNGLYMLVSVLVIQVILGIATLVNCVGTIPVGLGVLHQAGALLLLTAMLFVDYQLFARVEK
jgi:cytochrome c oxidase assembly protein subunit 15